MINISVIGVIWGLICIALTIYGSFSSIVSLLIMSAVLQCTSSIDLMGKSMMPMFITAFFVIIKYYVDGIGRLFILSIDPVSKYKAFRLFGIFCWISLINTICFAGIGVLSDYTYTLQGVIVTYSPLYLNGGQLFKLIKITIMIMCGGCILNASAKGFLEVNMDKVFTKTIVFVLVFGIIQYLLDYNGIYSKFLASVVYTDSGGAMLYHQRDRYHRLFSCFSEPSYCGAFLAAAFWYCYTKKKYSLSIIVLIELMLNSSATGFSSFAAGAFIWIIVSEKNRRYIAYLTLSSVVGAVLFFSPIGQYAFNYVIAKMGSGSGAVRTTWDIECFKILINTRFLGAGYGTVRGNSILLTIVGSMGVIGLILFLNMLLSMFRIGFNWHDEYERVFLSVVIAACFISCPDLTFSLLWMGIYAVLCKMGLEYEMKGIVDKGRGIF